MPPPKSIFTAHERAALKSHWGSQATRLTRDSFLPFGSCALCLLPSVDPVCCPQGDLFCRECAMTNLLAQRQEMKRLEKLAERHKVEAAEQQARDDEEARVRAVRDFEHVQMGMGGHDRSAVREEEDGRRQPGPRDAKGTKRKFALDADEVARIAAEDRSRAKRALAAERSAAKTHLPSFWVPGETPDQHHAPAAAAKASPTCPSSAPEDPHPLSLAALTSISFHEEKSAETGKSVRTCPSCSKALSNSTKAVVAVPCGHVLCKPCVDRFLRPEHRHHRDAHDDAEPEEDELHCYVCDADLSGRTVGKENGAEGKKKKKKAKDKAPKPGLVEIRSEGTGFAGGGKAMVKRDGVAFQA